MVFRKFLNCIKGISNELGLLRVVFLALFIVISVQNLYAQESTGEKDGGGGNVISFSGQRNFFLLDRLMLNPSLVDIDSNASIQVRKKTIERDQAFAAPLNDDDKSALQLANSKLDRWVEQLSSENQKVSIELIILIKTALSRMRYVRVPFLFNTQQRFVIPQNLKMKKAQIRTAILYLDKFGAFISTPVWDDLDPETQAGLFIHEAIRQIQFQYGFHDLTDANLQYITALIVDGAFGAPQSFEFLMSPSLHRLCFVLAVAKRPGPNQLLASIAVSNNYSLQMMLDENQKNKSREIVSEIMLGKVRELLRQKILKP